MAPQATKGKQGTRGAKQILEENAQTLKFYRYMTLASNAVFFPVMFFLPNGFTGLTITLSILSLLIHTGSYQFMAMICKAKVSETGALLDTGTDLNIEGGIAEHVKDIIILTAITELLALFSNYFWLILLLAPVRCGWMLWQSVIQPWLQQKSEAPAVDEKKQKKMDRKMKRMR